MLTVTYLVYVRGVAASLRFEPNWWYNLAMDQIYVYLLYIFLYSNVSTLVLGRVVIPFYERAQLQIVQTWQCASEVCAGLRFVSGSHQRVEISARLLARLPARLPARLLARLPARLPARHSARLSARLPADFQLLVLACFQG